MRSCSFTGHRNIPVNLTPELENLINKALEYAYSEGCRDFYAGGAIGFDTMCARAVVLFKLTHRDVKLHLVLPCKNQDKMWSEKQRSAYEYILFAADDAEYVSEDYTPECMKRRNARLVELCDIVIAYVGRYNSGAAQTVRMAKAAGKSVYNLYPRINGCEKYK